LATKVIQVANEQRSTKRASRAEISAAQEALIEALQVLRLRGGELFIDPTEIERLQADPPADEEPATGEAKLP